MYEFGLQRNTSHEATVLVVYPDKELIEDLPILTQIRDIRDHTI